MLNEKNAFILTLILYAASAALYFLFFMGQKEKYSHFGAWMLRIGFVLHCYALLNRTIEASYIPLTNQYEFATCFAWGAALCFIVSEYRYKLKSLGTFVVPIILLLALYAAMQSNEIKPIMPVLKSNWLIFHVSTAILSYGSFAIGCAASLMYVIKDRSGSGSFADRHIPDFEKLDRVSYKAIAFGFLMLTFVIVTGAIWAERAWGRYWQWDPKETWSLITWIIYAVYLHVRLYSGWKNKNATWYAILGFISVLFTYIGVNVLLTGYHSYGMLLIR